MMESFDDLSIHDNEIVKYDVNFSSKQIVLYTKNKINEEVNIIFSEVFSYFFENPLQKNILLDIEIDSLENFIKKENTLLSKGKKYGWPKSYKNLEELLLEMKKQRINYYRVFSSEGLSGWVLAEQYCKKTRRQGDGRLKTRGRQTEKKD